MKIGVFYKSYQWENDWFDKLLKQLDQSCVSSVSKSVTQHRVYLKDWTLIMSCPINDSSRGLAFDKVFVEPGISDETIDAIIKPCIKIPRIVIEYERL